MNPATITPPPQFENPAPFRFNLEQYRRLGELGFFGERGAVAVIGLSLGVCFFAVVDTLCSGCSRATKFKLLVSAGSFVPVALWIFMFQNHTSVHASFMVRILVVVPMAGAVTAWMWAHALAEERESGGESLLLRLRFGGFKTPKAAP